MLRKIIGMALIVISAFIFLVLLMSGMLIFPHVIGPITLAVIGAALLLYRGKDSELKTN